jgi:flagellar hook assembly protein FlgD
LVSLKHEEVYEIPDAISEVSCLPNPFNEKTNISFRLNEAMQVWVEIFDMNGKKINTLLQGELPGGYYSTTWNGDNEKGSKVNKGVYFYKIRTNSGTVVSEKMVLIK